MKNLTVYISLLTLLIANTSASSAVPASNPSTAEDSLVIWCSPDLYDLVVMLEEEYTGIYPEVKASVVNVPVDLINSKLSTNESIGFLSKEYLPDINNNSEWKMSIGREVFVLVVNHENPFLEKINTRGISLEKLIAAFNGEANPAWGTLLGNEKEIQPVNSYWLNDGSTRSYLKGLFGTNQFGASGHETSDADELINKIHDDKYAIGFCRLAYILDNDNQTIDERIKLVPVDVNGNNTIDYFEDIYGSYNDFARGVWIGKYPRELCGNIYTISGIQPSNSGQLAFMEWVLTDGQQYLYPNGYSELLSSEKIQKIQSLNAKDVPLVKVHKAPMRAVTILLFLTIIVVAGIIGIIIIQLFARRKPDLATEPGNDFSEFNEDSVSAPGGLFFDKTHTWAFMEEDGSVRIGIDDFLQHIASPVTKIRMKTTGEKIKKGKVFASLIQNGKQLDIYSPVSGIIKEYNERLINNSSLINTSPFSDGWVCKVEPDNWIMEIRSFLMSEKYRGWIRKEFIRLKDFLSSTLKPDLLGTSQVIMQDGGELRDNLLECLGPEDWEKFQTGFIDVSK